MITSTALKYMAQAKGLLELSIQGAENHTIDEAQTERWLHDIITSCRLAIRHLASNPITAEPAYQHAIPSDCEGTEEYPLPPYELLKTSPEMEESTPDTRAEMVDMQHRLCQTMNDFKIHTEPGDITRGAAYTRYEFYPAKGLRMNKICYYADNLMLTAQAKSINILAPIPGKNTIGIELENKQKDTVYLRDILQSPDFQKSTQRIPIALGKDVYGNPVIADLTTLQHLLIAGNAGSGKSVCINSVILSMLYKFSPNQLKFILADPKVVNMQIYKKLPHLLCPPISTPSHILGALRWAINEMEHRYKLFGMAGVRTFEKYNKNQESNTPTAKLPYIVIIIDELADFMMQEKEELETYIARLTQKSGIVGIHLIAATQTTRANVITGIIKANIPGRLAFKVTSPLDSRVILDTNGAENLLGKGDFLFLPPEGITKMTRAQGAFVSDLEIASTVKFCAAHAKQNFVQGVTAEMLNSDTPVNDGRTERNGMSDEDSELYKRCVQFVKAERKAGTSMLQRRFSIGYGRAAKIMDMMEKRGVIGPASGNTSRPREVLID